MSSEPHVDFFISYNSHDEKWAVWIAWILEKEGFECKLQAWDFRPGANFVLEMQKASISSQRTIAVLSPAYLDSQFAAPEWAVEFARDPQGKKRRLVPVRVEECNPEGLLGPIVYIDLVGLEGEAAKAKLLAGIEPGRSKPLHAPEFPGSASQGGGETTQTEQGTGSEWKRLAEPLPVTWRFVNQRGSYGGSLLEVHLIPVGSENIEARVLRGLGEQLVDVGRRGGLFAMTRGVTVDLQSNQVVVTSDDMRSEAGLAFSRAGERTAWFPLPSDSMGAIFDAADMIPRLSSVLQTLIQLPVPMPSTFGVGLALANISMLTKGDAGVLGKRSGATLPYAGRGPVTIDPEDTISASTIRKNADSVSEELVARLELVLQ